jgi:hypothetical protein
VEERQYGRSTVGVGVGVVVSSDVMRFVRVEQKNEWLKSGRELLYDGWWGGDAQWV